jgi:hypothetical protein
MQKMRLWTVHREARRLRLRGLWRAHGRRDLYFLSSEIPGKGAKEVREDCEGASWFVIGPTAPLIVDYGGGR